MLRHRMTGIHFDHGAGDGIGCERIVGGRLDQAIGLGQRSADDGERGHHRHIAGSDMQLPVPTARTRTLEYAPSPGTQPSR